MRLIDSSAWIEWMVGSPVGAVVAKSIPDKAFWVVPTVVQLELAKWLKREMGDQISEKVIAFTETCVVTPLDTKLALVAADVIAELKLSMADAIIYATALVYCDELVTCDAHFAGLPKVTYHAKSGNIN
jgi:predicted nucleic acid-binding protein